MNWKVALGGALLVIPLLIVLAMGFNADPHAVPSMLEGQPAPDFTLESLTGGPPVHLAALRGRPVVLNFWATWCYPCQAEHGLLQEAAAYYGERVQFLGMVYQDIADDMRAYLRAHPSMFPQLMDPGSRAAIDYGVAGVPESFILAPDGRIVHKQSGVPSAAVLRQQLDPLVALGGAK